MLLKAGGTPFQLRELCDGDVVLQHLHTREVRLVREQKLLEDMLSGEVTELNAPDDRNRVKEVLGATAAAEVHALRASAAAAKRMVDKIDWLRALRAEGIDKIEDKPWVRQKVDQIAVSVLSGVRRFEIGTLIKADRVLKRAGGDAVALLPKFGERGGAGKSRLSESVEKIIQDELKLAQEAKGRFVKQHLVQKIQLRASELANAEPAARIVIPGASTISRRIDREFSAYERCLRNEGRDRALKEFRENGARISAERPLEEAQIDDIDSGVFLIDEHTNLPVGRGYLTNSIDQLLGVPLGFSLGHEFRSIESAVDCVLDGLMPKDETLHEFENLAHSWVGFGTAGVNLMDNALYNHATAVERVQLNLKQKPAWSRPRQPTDKSTIEHYNHIIKNTFCCRLPGWRGAKGDEDGSKNGMVAAVMTEQNLRREYVVWVTSEYLNSPGVDGFTPRQRWARYFTDHRPIVRWSRQQIAFMRMRSHELRFRDSGGVLRLGLRYQSDELADARRFAGKNAKVQIFTDRKDLSYIIFKHPATGVLLKASCIEDERYVKGMTERQQQLVRKQARELGHKNPSIAHCVEARQALVLRTEQMRKSTKLRARQWAYLNAVPPMTGESNTAQAAKPRMKEVRMSDLEWNILQLDQIQLDGEEDWA